MPVYDITNPSYFRNAKNKTGSTIVRRRFVDYGTNEDECVLPAATTSRKHWGATVEDMADQDTRSIQVDGVVVVECSAAIAAHAEVQSGTDGRAATAVSTSSVRGRAKNATSQAGDLVAVELYKSIIIAP